MAQEIYHRSEWGNPNEQWGNVYLNADLTNELYKRASEYENSWVTDQLLNGVGTKPSIIMTPTAYEDGKLLSVKPAKTFGSELVVNGTFDTDSDWTKGIGWTIANGKATCDGTQSTTSGLIQNNVFENNKKYKLTFDLTSNGQELKIWVNGTQYINSFYSSNTYNLYINTNTSGNIYFEATVNFIGSIDNVSVKEVIDADFSFTRGSSATRVNEKGLIQDVQILSDELVQNGNFEEEGSELVVNGDFSNGSANWVLGNGWSVVESKAVQDGTGSGSSLQQSNILVVGKTYKIQYEIINVTQGSIDVFAGFPNSNVPNNNTIGVHTHYIKAEGNTSLYLRPSNFIGSIDNVSVKEVGQNWTFGTSWSMGENKAIYTTGSATGIQQDIGLIGNKKYKITFNNSGSSLNLYLGSNTSAIPVSPGLFEQTLTTVSNTNGVFYISNASGWLSGYISNISVIEITDDTDLPRINYTNFDYENGEVVPYSGEGSLLLEPQSTNLITYSEDFSQWQSGGGTQTIVANATTSPEGVNNASSIQINSGYVYKQVYGLSVSSGDKYTWSCYVKSSSQKITFGGGTVAGTDIYSSEDAGNGWYKQKLTRTFLTNGTIIQPMFNESQSGTDLFYIWGAQLEALSYATSYIPTNGSTVTRLADVCNNAGSSDLINSTEGVLYAEIAYLSDTGTYRTISINDGTNNNMIAFESRPTSNQIKAFVNVSGINVMNSTQSLTNVKEFNKIAIKWKQDDFALWVNGVQIHEDLSGSTFASGVLNKLNFNNGIENFPFEGKVKCVAVFKEALSDEELQKLTQV